MYSALLRKICMLVDEIWQVIAAQVLKWICKWISPFEGHVSLGQGKMGFHSERYPKHEHSGCFYSFNMNGTAHCQLSNAALSFLHYLMSLRWFSKIMCKSNTCLHTIKVQSQDPDTCQYLTSLGRICISSHHRMSNLYNNFFGANEIKIGVGVDEQSISFFKMLIVILECTPHRNTHEKKRYENRLHVTLGTFNYNICAFRLLLRFKIWQRR